MAYGLSHRRALKSVAFEADFKRKSDAKATYLGCPCDPEHKPKLAVGLLDAVESAVATAETCSQQQQQQLGQNRSAPGCKPVRERALRKQRISAVRAIQNTNQSLPWAFSTHSTQL
jgi:hypothetical protein